MAVPRATAMPPRGSVRMIRPASVSGSWASERMPAARSRSRRVATASASVKPRRSGTATVGCGAATVRRTTSPGSTSVPGGGSCAMTVSGSTSSVTSYVTWMVTFDRSASDSASAILRPEKVGLRNRVGSGVAGSSVASGSTVAVGGGVMKVVATGVGVLVAVSSPGRSRRNQTATARMAATPMTEPMMIAGGVLPDPPPAVPRRLPVGGVGGRVPYAVPAWGPASGSQSPVA